MSYRQAVSTSFSMDAVGVCVIKYPLGERHEAYHSESEFSLPVSLSRVSLPTTCNQIFNQWLSRSTNVQSSVLYLEVATLLNL